MTTEIINIHLRPNMFAVWPNSGRTTVDDRMYEFVIHMYSSPASTSRAIVGRAVERMDVSRAERKVVTHSAGNTAQKRQVFFGVRRSWLG
jgi:hypothetical protein